MQAGAGSGDGDLTGRACLGWFLPMDIWGHAAAWHFGDIRDPRWSCRAVSPWGAAGAALLGTLSDSPTSAAAGGARPACHVGVENSPTLLQTFWTCLDLPGKPRCLRKLHVQSRTSLTSGDTWWLADGRARPSPRSMLAARTAWRVAEERGALCVAALRGPGDSCCLRGQALN